jgi:hypothetical protein
MDNVAVGGAALQVNTTGGFNIAIGSRSMIVNTTGTNNIAIGYQSGWPSAGANGNVSGAFNTFIGDNSGPGTATQLTNATAIGAGSTVSVSNGFILGGINGVNGVTADTLVGLGIASPTAQFHQVIGASGTVGYLTKGASGQTANLSEWRDNSNNLLAFINAAGGVICRSTALATNATDGFFRFPTCAGTPTGTPATGEGSAIVDSTNHKLYVYLNGTWVAQT